jgi:hypothetical protein
MEVVSALIHVSDISTRNKPHKDPDPPAGGQDDPKLKMFRNRLVHKLARASALRLYGIPFARNGCDDAIS